MSEHLEPVEKARSSYEILVGVVHGKTHGWKNTFCGYEVPEMISLRDLKRSVPLNRSKTCLCMLKLAPVMSLTH